MSAILEFLTRTGFWWGVPAGTISAALVAAKANRASDARKAAQEHAMLDRKEGREDRLRQEEAVFNAGTEFAAVCSEIVTTAMNVKSAFNAIRDMMTGVSGGQDPKAAEKLDEAAQMAENSAKIIKVFNALKMVAPDRLLASATRLNTAVLALLHTTTQPFARVVALKTAAAELDSFTNDFREECGRSRYSESDAKRDALSFMETLKKQTDEYKEEAIKDMRAAGFRTTPWDMPDNPNERSQSSK